MRVFEAVLAALADHGFTPTAIVTRLTWLSAPDSVQGALASGLLGGGSRFLGVTEDCGRFLHDVLESRRRAADRRRRLGRARAGHRAGSPRGRRARARPGPPRAQGRRPPHPAADGDRPRGGPVRAPPGLFAAIGRVHGEVLGQTLPLNGAGVCGAALADLGLPIELLRAFALLARTAGLIGQLAEEIRHPVANDIFLSVDLNNRPVDPDPLPFTGTVDPARRRLSHALGHRG